MALNKNDIEVGQSYSMVLVDDLTRTQLVQYAGASGDYNPIHTDDLYTREVAGYPGVFAHGMLTMGMTGRLLTDTVGDAMLTYYGVRFVSQVWPGDTLTATMTVTDIRNEDGQDLADFDVATVNQDGVTVLTGKATAKVVA